MNNENDNINNNATLLYKNLFETDIIRSEAELNLLDSNKEKAENEVLTDDGFLYEAENKTLSCENKINELRSLFNQIRQHRKDKRSELIQKFCLSYVSFLKNKGFQVIDRRFFNKFSNNLNKRQQERLTTECLNFCKDKKVLTEYKEDKPLYFLRNKPLSSADFKSYSLLMQKNGYKRFLFKWNGILKEGLKTTEINQSIETFEDSEVFSEIRSQKPHEKQAVYTNGNKSIVLEKYYYEKIAYQIN